MSQKINARIIKTEEVNWRELQFIQQENFKEIPVEARHKLKASIVSNNFVEPFYVWESPEGVLYCLDGKHRTIFLEELINEGFDVPYKLPATFIDCADKKEAAKLVLVFSSTYAKVTQEGLIGFISLNDLQWDKVKGEIDLPDFNFEAFDTSFSESGNTFDPIVPQSLSDRFIIPPFSIFDTRQGYWQDRKKAWHALGFDSQETREDLELVARSGQAPAVYELRNNMRDLLKRDPTWDEIIAEAEKRGMHIYSGASVFDPVLCEVCYKWFVPLRGTVVDPFAGGSVRGIVAAKLGLNYVGIDLRADQVEANKKQAEKTCSLGSYPTWYVGDSNELLDDLPSLEGDFIFSCPPYHDLEQYSDDPADLSNMNYDDFITIYRSIIQKSVAKLRDNRFACFVVGDIRDKDGMYRNFVSDTISAFHEAGMKLYNEIILVNVAGSLPVRIGRQFGGYRKVGKMHQNVLVFYKGDPKKIKDEFPEINIEKDLQELNYQPNIALSVVSD